MVVSRRFLSSSGVSIRADQFVSTGQKQKQQQAENAEGGAAKKKKVTAAQLRVQRGSSLHLRTAELDLTGIYLQTYKNSP